MKKRKKINICVCLYVAYTSIYIKKYLLSVSKKKRNLK